MDTLRDVVARYLTDGPVPGLAYAVTDGERTLVEGQSGLRDLAAGTPVTPDTLFEIGSIGKTFTAIVVLQLVDEGRIDLHAPVRAYLPWFRVPRTGDRITIHHLLNHTAGITAGVDATPEATFQVHALRRLAPGSAPGRRVHYSNVGYKALGLVIEAVERRTYPSVLRDRVLEPLGMAATTPDITAAIRRRLATGHETAPDDRISHGGLPLVASTWLETATADGSIASTASDMARFARALIAGGPPVLPAGGVARMVDAAGRTAPSAPAAYGYGIVSRTLGGRRWIGHGGGMVGYLAGVQVDVAAGVGAVVLQNGMAGSPNAVARELVRLTIGGIEGRSPNAAPGAATDAQVAPGAATDTTTELPLPGAYAAEGNPTEATFEVRLVGGNAILVVDRESVELVRYGSGTWLAPHPTLDRHLLRADGLDEGGWLWHGGTRYIRRGAAAPPLPDPGSHLRSFVGHYRSHNPWTTNFRVVLRGDRLWLTFSGTPDGFEDEQPLAERRDGSFRVGDDPLGPERIRFDTMVDGRALRTWLSGWEYYRVGD